MLFQNRQISFKSFAQLDVILSLLLAPPGSCFNACLGSKETVTLARKSLNRFSNFKLTNTHFKSDGNVSLEIVPLLLVLFRYYCKICCHNTLVGLKTVKTAISSG